MMLMMLYVTGCLANTLSNDVDVVVWQANILSDNVDVVMCDRLFSKHTV